MMANLIYYFIKDTLWTLSFLPYSFICLHCICRIFTQRRRQLHNCLFSFKCNCPYSSLFKDFNRYKATRRKVLTGKYNSSGAKLSSAVCFYDCFSHHKHGGIMFSFSFYNKVYPRFPPKIKAAFTTDPFLSLASRPLNKLMKNKLY